MTAYKSYRELHGKTLKYDDCVFFQYEKKGTTYEMLYEVRSCFLNNETTGDNAEIFNLIGFDKNRYEYASRLYGYKSNTGEWPVFRDGDYKAATVLVLDIFRKLSQGGPTLKSIVGELQ